MKYNWNQNKICSNGNTKKAQLVIELSFDLALFLHSNLNSFKIKIGIALNIETFPLESIKL